jgi:hypothetical protein
MDNWMPGDIGFSHNKGIIARAIQFGEAIRNNKHDAQLNHAFVLDRFEDGKWFIIQAEAKGVTNDKTIEQVAPKGYYKVYSLPADVDRDKVLEFARAQVGAKYGFFTILSCVLDILLPDSICLRRAYTWICSGLAAAALMYGGWKGSMRMATKDIYTMMPCELYGAFDSM